MISCCEDTLGDIKKNVFNQIKFLHHYSTLINFYTLAIKSLKIVPYLVAFRYYITEMNDSNADYFVHEHWKQIPLSWQHILEKFEVQDLGNFLDSTEEFRFPEILPLSLLAFRATARALSLSRYVDNSLELFDQFIYDSYGLQKADIGKFVWEDPKKEFQKCPTQHKGLPQSCRRRVKPKKQHEIYRLSQLMNLSLEKIHINHVMDIGSGLGHLSRLLCLNYNWKVVTIEAESRHTSTASNLDKQAFSFFQKEKINSINYNEAATSINVRDLPQHLDGLMLLSSSQEDLQNIIRQAWKDNDSNEDRLRPFALMGLHTCGDLAATLMRIFIETSEARILLSVGCCYMKLSTGSPSCGFPLSSYVKKLPNSFLGRETREIACHALENYVNRLKENGESLKIHCYRAMLEKILVKHSPNLRHLGLKGVKHAEKLKFHEYAMKALKNVPVEIPKEDIESFDSDLYLKEWKNVVAIYSLRLLTAPVIENMILMDRMLFLFEHDTVWIKKIEEMMWLRSWFGLMLVIYPLIYIGPPLSVLCKYIQRK